MTLTEIPKCPHHSTRTADEWPTRRVKARRRRNNKRAATQTTGRERTE